MHKQKQTGDDLSRTCDGLVKGKSITYCLLKVQIDLPFVVTYTTTRGDPISSSYHDRGTTEVHDTYVTMHAGGYQRCSFSVLHRVCSKSKRRLGKMVFQTTTFLFFSIIRMRVDGRMNNICF